METPAKLHLFSFKGRMRVLHLNWVAFFITFVIWFNHAPLLASIRDTLHLTDQEIGALLILNVALTIPARILIGMLVDSHGPRLVYTALLAVSGVLCLLFAVADSFEMLALTRFLLGFVGAGFVIGIRAIGEWFPARQVGLAEGIYGGWGNFGAAAAAVGLPTVALMFGGADGWRYAVGATGLVALVYAGIYYRWARNTPKGSTYFKPKKTGAIEVSDKTDFFLHALMQVPLYLAPGLLAWKLGPGYLALLSPLGVALAYGVLGAFYIYQIFRSYQINRQVFTAPVAKIHRYHFKQVAVLNLAYLVTFGSELAVISMLPLFFMDTFGLSQIVAGILAAGFACMNLFARPGGGMLSDRFGRKRVLMVLIGGLGFGFLAMSQIDQGWWVPLAVLVSMFCSFFVQAGAGAVFSMVPLIKRRLTGQIAGMVGAYGNVGAVVFLTVLSFVSPHVFFLVIAGTAVLVLIGIYLFLNEPEGHMVEVLPDGTVQMIDAG
ncbi:MAG: MFS transporter [Rhodospirillaceae bacterium]|nr:MAG: MFS transporter [Rhodospirillaceae bacterium]